MRRRIGNHTRFDAESANTFFFQGKKLPKTSRYFSSAHELFGLPVATKKIYVDLLFIDNARLFLSPAFCFSYIKSSKYFCVLCVLLSCAFWCLVCLVFVFVFVREHILLNIILGAILKYVLELPYTLGNLKY